MPRPRKQPPPPRTHRWYLAEWAQYRDKIQADLIRDLGWSRSSASELWTNKQRYTQDHVDEAARWLKILPYELLMPPKEAMAIRRMREMAHTIAAEDGESLKRDEASEVLKLPAKTGTRG